MQLLRQLAFGFRQRSGPDLSGSGDRASRLQPDIDIQSKGRDLLRANGAGRIANKVRVQWSPRLKTCAGRADWKHWLISLNPRLQDHGAVEIDRTLRHELAHLLAHIRAGRRKIPPHGPQWRQACCDLGIADEARCHHLPFPVQRRARRYHYGCPNCQRSFPRVRRIGRASACLACCRAHNRGKFDARFRLKLITA